MYKSLYQWHVAALVAACLSLGACGGEESVVPDTGSQTDPPPTPPPPTPPPPPPSPPPAASDFPTRCAASGVVKCVGFDTAADISGDWDDPSGILSGATTPGLDAGIKASGASSLKFTIPSNSGSDSSGSYFTNFAQDLSVQFGGGQDFYVQWRQRFSAAILSTQYAGGTGWKQIIVGTGDKPTQHYASCTALEVVLTNYYQKGFPIAYNSCTGSTSHGPYDGFYENFGASDFKLQNARPSPYCLYSQGKTNPNTFYAPGGNCFGYAADEWMTFQLGFRLGARVNDEFRNSFVTLWIAREGQPSEAVIEWGPYNLSAGSAAEDQKYGKVWLLPYHTNKDSSQSHPTAFTWYDELIISRNRIADPGTSAGPGPGDTTRPSTPTALVANASSSSQINLSWNAASDNVAVTGYRVYRNSTHVASPSGTSHSDVGLTADTTYSYTVAAVDAAANVSLQSNSVGATTPTGPPPPPPPVSGTSLAQLAASLQAGGWAELNTIGFNNGLFLETAARKSVLEYSDKAVWDPVRQQLRFVGAPHYEPVKHIVYSESTNTWTAGANPAVGLPVHGYQHNAINPATGESYYRQYGSANVYRYSPAANAWSSLPSIPFSGLQCCGAIEYFPERNELVFVDGNWGVFTFSFASNQWTRRVPGNADAGGLAMGNYHNVAVYSPSAKAILLGGGGTSAIFKYDTSGNVTRLADAPLDIGVMDTITTVDPVSGKFLIIGADRSFREFDLSSGTWRSLNANIPMLASAVSNPVVFDIVAAPVSTRGVIIFVKHYFDQSKVYVYKHTGS